MNSFPVYTVLYCIYVVALFVVISYIGGQETLYCSHETIYLSVLEPSIFSQISGIHCIATCVYYEYVYMHSIILTHE